MIDLLTAVRKFLKENVAVASAATGGIHILKSPQNSKLPNVVLKVLRDGDDWTHQGPMNLHEGIVRVVCRSTDIEQLSILRTAVYQVLQGLSGTNLNVTIDNTFFRNGVTDNDDRAEIYRTHDDFEVKYRIG